MYYFQQFKTLLYTFDENKYDYRSVVNIFARVNIIQDVLTNSLVYYQYAVKDSDTTEGIASKYYGDPLRHWMVMYANQITDPWFDMPLKECDLENNLVLKYGSLANAQATLYQVQQFMNVTTTFNGTSNTISYVSTLDQNYSYNFTTGNLEDITLPSIEFPILDQGSTTVVFPDGTTVVTDTVWVAQSAYDFYVQQNEEKRQIQLLDKQYAGTLEQELTQLLST
jgi:hypothetical protein